MITEAEIIWLQNYYTTLAVNSDRTEVTGKLAFSAAYDKSTDIFTPLTLPGQKAKGVVLSGSYTIEIKKHENNMRLPSLAILSDEVPYILDRHLYKTGKACLCGVVEEVDFVQCGFSFPLFLEQLVIPFLYGQVYFTKNGVWPWRDYAHGSIGILESYYRSASTLKHVEVCLTRLRVEKITWPQVYKILSGKEKFDGATKCLCFSGGRMKTCHPAAWFGLLKLKNTLRPNEILFEESGLEKI